VCLGDLHIPERKQAISSVLSKKILRISPDLVLSTGDHTEYFVLKSLEKFGHVEAVNGNMENLGIERVKVIKVLESIKILLLHGDQFGRGNIEAVAEHAKKLNCSIAVSGHTHTFEAKEINGVVCVNPGTVTGAWGSAKLEEESVAVIELKQAETKSGIEIKVKKLFLDERKNLVESVAYSGKIRQAP